VAQSVAHACVLQVVVSAECAHALPPKVGATFARLRLCEPVPHDFEHLDQAPKVPSTQSIEHSAVLHSRVSAACGQAAPPYRGAALVRLRFCVPPPHDLVHVDQALHVYLTQSSGHSCLLQSLASAGCGHAVPPFCGAIKVRLRDCAPVPHDLVQEDQADQSPTLQSVGQLKVLHVDSSEAVGQLVPPLTGAVSARTRFIAPPSHDAEQADHAPHSAMTQSAGHAKMLQSCASSGCGHALPPPMPAVVSRLRCREPAPHDAVQVVHAPHAETRQSTGQAVRLQSFASAGCGHAVPPFCGAIKVRLRDCAPVPHDLVQEDQADQSPTLQSVEHS
jgi:hypothetical protein